ncbi:MAG: hypothetical protein H0W15_09740 [Gemmatimonadales bacterium]|nr:hypothetical protein [Gemmatimonadales bacterium]
MINLVGLYLFALIIGGGLLLISVFGGADGDASDVDGDLEVHGHGAMGEIGDLMLGLFRPRNLTFLLAAFGATGLLLTWVGTSSILALLLAASMGAGSWVLSHALFTWLRRTDSGVSVLNDRALEGSIGRVTLPVGPGARGRITLVVAGQQTWITARVESGVERILPVGTEVLIRRTEGGVAEVIPTDILELPPAS